MGFMDFLSASVKSAVDSLKDGDITGLMEGGLIGNKIMRDQKMAVQQAESRKKPGKFCDNWCPVNDMRCEACLKQQEELTSGLEELFALEKNINSFKSRQDIVIPTACSLCGAPIEKGERECPYCGTKYSAETSLGDLPQTDFERDKLLIDRTTEVFASYAALYKKQMEYKKENIKLPSIMKGFANAIAGALEKGVDMDAAMIRQGAADNGVSYPAYIAGVMTGQYQSVAMINLQNQLDQQNERIAEMRRQQEEYNARSRQIEAERQAKLRKINQERSELQMQMVSARSSSYGYNGGGSRCCGTCRYYGAGKCCATGGKYEGWDRNASDSNCGWFALK